MKVCKYLFVAGIVVILAASFPIAFIGLFGTILKHDMDFLLPYYAASFGLSVLLLIIGGLPIFIKEILF